MPTTSYWLEDAADPLPRRRFHGRPDVLVIGAGVTGCACALRLGERGVRVRVHDARAVAGGASGRNGGFALRGLAMPYDDAVTLLGRGEARRVTALTEQGLDRLEALAGDAFLRVGSLRLAADEAEREALRREHDALAADGFAVEWVDALPAPLDRLYHGAILHPGDGSIHPARWVRRLAARAAEAGAEFAEGSPLTVDDAVGAAEAVVVATDGFTASVVPELEPFVRSTRGQVLVTAPLPEIRYGRPHYARGGFDYWQQLPDGRLVLGGRRDASVETEWTDVDEPTEAIQSLLDELAADLAGADVRVTHRWAGIWGTTGDLLPLVGAVPGRERVWIAAGYSGHGNVLGLVCGSLLADVVAGHGAADPTPFDPSRFA